MPPRKYLIPVVALLALVPLASIAAQASTDLRFSHLWSAGTDRGGPETKLFTLALATDGTLAFTRGSDAGARQVTLMDSAGRLLSHLGGRGSGPGEFQAVFGLFFADVRLFASGVGQISAFDRSGRHLFSRALLPQLMPVAVHGDSVDLLDASGFMTGRSLGEIRRRSLALNGRDRTLVPATDPAYRDLARHPVDSSRFVRIAYAANGKQVVLANPFTYRMLAYDGNGTLQRRFGRDLPLLRLTGSRLDAEVARNIEEARRPFRLPDGTYRQMPDRSAAIRREAAAPKLYFSVRDGGLFFGATPGEVFVIETATDVVHVVRFRGAATVTAAVPCDARGGNVALAGRFLALTCATGGDTDGIELRLYRMH